MALTKEIVPGSIEIFEEGQMQVRDDTVVLEDGVEISRTYHRTTLVPGDDVSGQLQRVQDIANLLWTAQVVADWKLKHPFVPPV